MRKLLLLLLFPILPALLFAQNHTNAWIDFSRQYFKIKVARDGVYRISYTTLQNAGIPVNTVNPMNYQIFHAGQEQHIYVHGESDGVFHTTDYIEFYGQKNSGWLEKQLYADSTHQANPNHSLFNDTISYFLTWNTSLNNRRVSLETDVAFGNYAPAPYFWHVARQDYTSGYYSGKPINKDLEDSDYVEAEGWFDNALTLGNSTTKNINTARAVATGPAVKVDIVLAGASHFRFSSPPYYRPDHHLRVQFAGITIDTIYEGYRLIRLSQQLSPSQLGTGNTSFVFSSINDLGAGADRSAVSSVTVKYPRDFDMLNAQEFRMFIPNAIQTKSLINITNLNTSNSTAFIYDLTNKRRITVQKNGNIWQALVPNATSGEKECYLTSDSRVNNVAQLIPVGTNGQFTNFNTLPSKNADYVFITHSSLRPEVNNYALYRGSAQGGGYRTLVVDIDELYDQFAYGIPKNPLAIRNFVKYSLATFTDTLKALFLVGKAYTPHIARNNSQYYATNLVPTIGYPSSDVMLISGIIDNLYQMAVPIGRLSAKNPTHVAIYLDKAKEYDQEKASPQQWMKNVVHFAGGANSSEQSLFDNYLRNYADTIRKPSFGGFIKTYYKTSPDPIQINLTTEIKNLINNGVSLMTFFGHAAGIGFDISIDHPSEYQNKGKYPFLLANSCFAGDIFGIEPSSSDEFVLIQNKGVIGYLASISKGIPSTLNLYSSHFYKNLSRVEYGNSIGRIIQQTIKDIQTNTATVKQVCYEMTLHGDPAVVFNSQPKPDYYPQTVFYSPGEITNTLDTFEVNVVVNNKGRALNQLYIVQLDRTLPGTGITQSYFEMAKAAFYSDTVVFRIPLGGNAAIGLNHFSVNVDVNNSIDELNESNNTITSSLFIRSSDLIPIYPQNQAIIPQSNVTLLASTAYPFAGTKTYVFEIDTSELFSSPLKVRQAVTQAGGVVQWTVPFSLTDSLAYYWRVSSDSVSAMEGYNWRTASFQYISGRRGWAQSHKGQFGRNEYRYVNFDPASGEFSFFNNYNSLFAQTFFFYILPNGQYVHPWTDIQVKINNVINSQWSCLDHGMMFVVIDPISAQAWFTYPGAGGPGFGTYNDLACKNYPYQSIEFSGVSSSPPVSQSAVPDTVWWQRMKAFIDTIPAGHRVVVSSHRNHNAQNYPEYLKQAFESLGSGLIRSIPNERPYILFGQKGSPIGSAKEVVGLTIDSKINLSDSFVTKWDEGQMTSELIGPAQKWQSLHWRLRNNTSGNTDSVRLSVIGVKQNGETDVLISGLDVDSLDVFNLDSRIDAAIYPRLKLQLNMKDTSSSQVQSPAHLLRWQVNYATVPETSISPNSHFVFHADTLAEGDNLRLEYAIRNISDFDMDSLLVQYWISDKQGQIIPLAEKRLRPHPKNDILIDTIIHNTRGLAGSNSLWIEVNPNFDQPELSHFNNVGELPFFVRKDNTNPLLDVTFDGIHILNGDIVSARPEITISLRDENQFLVMDSDEDTAQFAVFLRRPGAQLPERVFFEENGERVLQFIIASKSNKTCRIIYKPIFTLDGKYQLSVQARDKSGNKSGSVDYSIAFEIINKSTITEVMNWPNPFSTRTHFVFTLTGYELPSYFKIQILTVTGKVVREIDLSELGPLHIGRNITQYAWDGKDQFGDPLANGLYLYRVVTRLNEKDIELRETGAAKYFNSGFGKMYLMR